MIRIFCDRCKVEGTAENRVTDYLMLGRLDPANGDDDLDYHIQGQNYELCQACVKKVGELLTAHVNAAMEVEGINLRSVPPESEAPKAPGSEATGPTSSPSPTSPVSYPEGKDGGSDG
jgi:hypothetical protein